MSQKSAFILECSYNSLIEDPFLTFETDSAFAHHSLAVGDEFYLYDEKNSFIDELENASQQKLDDAWRKRVVIKAKHHLIMKNESHFTHTIRLALEIKVL